MAKKSINTPEQKQMLQQMWQDSIPLPDGHEFYTWGNWQPGRLRQCHDNATINDGAKDISLKDHIVMQLHSKDGEVTDLVYFTESYGLAPTFQQLHYAPLGYPRGTASFGDVTGDAPIVLCRTVPEAYAVLEQVSTPVQAMVYFERASLRYVVEQYKTRIMAILVHDDLVEWLGKSTYDKGKVKQIPMRIDPANALGFDDEMFNECFNPLNEWLTKIKPLTPLNAKDSTPACKVNLTDGYGRWTLDGMVEHLFLIYGTDNVWDNLNQTRMRLSALRHAVGNNDDFKLWQTHPMRKTIKDLVFEPSGEIPENTINLFTGLPPQADVSTDKCQKILGHINRLCGFRKDEYDWLLRWMAYPLQNLGAKMDTAVIMYGSEGPGKSILWEKVLGKIYGSEYHRTIGQQQLESQFNGWLSKILFAQCEEVVSRAERNHHKGQLKHLVTGKEFIINEKMLPAYKETNHANFVFLSNSPIPLELDIGDRRYFVLRIDDVPDKQYFDDLFAEINGDGVASFYHYLMALPMDGFNPHTKPPLNNDKQKLIDASKPNPVLFYDEWSAGDLSVPYGCCVKADLFKAYRNWCNERNEHPKRDRDFNAEIDRIMINSRKNMCFPTFKAPKTTHRVWLTPIAQALFDKQDPYAIDHVTREATAFNQALYPSSKAMGDDAPYWATS